MWLWGVHATQNNHGPGGLRLSLGDPEQEVSDPEYQIGDSPGRCPPPGTLVPCAELAAPPAQRRMSAFGQEPSGEDVTWMQAAGETGSYYESAMAWMWLFCQAHPASCYGDCGN